MQAVSFHLPSFVLSVLALLLFFLSSIQPLQLNWIYHSQRQQQFSAGSKNKQFWRHFLCLALRDPESSTRAPAAWQSQLQREGTGNPQAFTPRAGQKDKTSGSSIFDTEILQDSSGKKHAGLRRLGDIKELQNKPSAGEQRAHSSTLGDVFMAGVTAVIRESCLFYVPGSWKLFLVAEEERKGLKPVLLKLRNWIKSRLFVHYRHQSGGEEKSIQNLISFSSPKNIGWFFLKTLHVIIFLYISFFFPAFSSFLCGYLGIWQATHHSTCPICTQKYCL